MTDFCLGQEARERIVRQGKLMRHMLAWLGAESDACTKGDAATLWSEARLKCIDCQWSHRCDAFLAAPPKARLAPGFCVNAGFFQQCTGEEGGITQREGVSS
jgi:hypothetical protein